MAKVIRLTTLTLARARHLPLRAHTNDPYERHLRTTALNARAAAI
jgi:hypothetical protein